MWLLIEYVFMEENLCKKKVLKCLCRFCFFWIKGFVSVDSRFVKTSTANTILGFIPAGKDKQNIPLKNISAVALSSKYLLKPMIIGIIEVLFGIIQIENGNIALGLIISVIGIATFLNGILTVLIIQRAGSNYSIYAPFYEKAKLAYIQEAIEEALQNDTDKTDLNLYHEKNKDFVSNQNDRIVDAIRANNSDK